MKIAFFKGRHPGVKGWLGVLTKWWTVGPYSHCELVVAEENGRAVCWSSAYLDGGVRQKIVDLDPADWDVIEIPTTPEEEAASLSWFQSHAGQGYDVLGLFQFVWARQEGEKCKWFCSEAVARALGFPESWRYSPNLLADILRREAAGGTLAW
jgi:hypothetical protein